MMTLVESLGASFPFDEAAVRALSSAAGEGPERLGRRLAALAGFDPGALQDSRYTRLALDWASLPLAAARFEEASISAGGVGPKTRHTRSLSAHLAAHPGAASALRGGASPWDPLALAAWREGAALVREPGETGSEVAYLAFGDPGGLVPEPVLFDVGEGAEASVFLHWRGGAGPSLHLSTLCGTVGAGARLKVFLLHEGASAHHVVSLNLVLRQDAQVEYFGAWMGGRWTVVRQRVELSEPGAAWRETQIAAGDGKEHFDWDTRVRHAAHHTASDVDAKAVLGGHARAVLTGNIRMERASTGGDARLASHVLMLSPGARADSVPGLEIKALDVKASHAASVGQVDEEQMVYLMSRGLDEAQARHAVVVGFLASLFGRAPLPFAAALLDPLLEAKIRA